MSSTIKIYYKQDQIAYYFKPRGTIAMLPSSQYTVNFTHRERRKP